MKKRQFKSGHKLVNKRVAVIAPRIKRECLEMFLNMPFIKKIENRSYYVHLLKMLSLQVGGRTLGSAYLTAKGYLL